MNISSFDDDIQQVLSMLLGLKEKVLEYFFNQSYRTYYKSKNDPVTEADNYVNDVIISFITKNFPNDTVISEELAGHIKQGGSKRTWILDPIDGTKEFVDKNPEFCISLGLYDIENGHLGFLYNPANNFLVFNDCNGVRYCLDRTNNFKQIDQLGFLNENTICVSRNEFNSGGFDKLITVLTPRYNIKPIGSIAYKLGLIVAKVYPLTISLRPKNIWDVAAGLAIFSHDTSLLYTSLSFEQIDFNDNLDKMPATIAGDKAIIKSLQELFPSGIES